MDTVPFEVGKGGRIKKFAEDKMVDVEMYGDERNFSDVKFQIIECHRGQIQFADRVSSQTEGNYGIDYYMIEDACPVEYVSMMWRDMHIAEEMDGTIGTIVEDVVEDMEKKIEEQDRERVLGQVNLRLAEMQLENMETDKKGERRVHTLDNIMRLNIFFEISGDQHRLSQAQKERDEGRSGSMVEKEESVKE